MKNKFRKSTLTILTLLLFIAAGSLTNQNVSALVDTPWGPDRATFTWDNPAPYATFNSITDNPRVGDERNFVQIREVNQQYYQDEVTLERGKTYEVYIYYHNNADGNEVGETAIGIADGAAVKSSFPATVKAGERATVTATIFASDTNPLAVWDGAYINPSQDLYLRYIPGTATIHNGGALDGQSIGPDALFGEGALLGYNKFSGILPGCNKYAGYITYQIFADSPGFDISKSVVGDYSIVKKGDVVTFKVRYDNTGTMDQTNVVVKDTLPDALQYVVGSAKLYNNNNPNGVSVNDDIISENGMNIGDYAGGTGWAEVTYQVMVKDNVNCNDKITNNVTVSTNDGNKHDDLTLTVTDDDCNVVEKTCKTNPEMEGCKELPNTGPVEIIMAIVIIIGIGTGGYYLYRTQKTLKTVEGDVFGKGDKEDKASSQKPDNMVK